MDLETNKGLIFKNDKKTEDKHPDYSGEVNCDGKVMRISMWIRTDKNGKKYFGASLSTPSPSPLSEPKKLEPIDDGLPF